MTCNSRYPMGLHLPVEIFSLTILTHVEIRSVAILPHHRENISASMRKNTSSSWRQKYFPHNFFGEDVFMSMHIWTD